MKVYLATTGEYSDYRIRAAFSTKEKAQEFLDAQTDYSPRVEEFEVDEWTRDMGRWTFDFRLVDGMIQKEEYDVWLEEQPDEAKTSMSLGAEMLAVTVYHGNKERAKKVASEIYTRIRANLDEAEERVRRLAPEGFMVRPMVLQVAKVLAGIVNEQSYHPTSIAGLALQRALEEKI